MLVSQSLIYVVQGVPFQLCGNIVVSLKKNTNFQNKYRVWEVAQASAKSGRPGLRDSINSLRMLSTTERISISFQKVAYKLSDLRSSREFFSRTRIKEENISCNDTESIIHPVASNVNFWKIEQSPLITYDSTAIFHCLKSRAAGLA